MDETSIEALFERYRVTGDAQALGAVFDHLAPQLLLVAGHLGGAAAEDLVQATFLDAIRHSQRWDAARPLAPWFVGLLGNHLREARRQRRRVPDSQRLEPARDEPPDAVAAANECLSTVHAAVERLPRHYRQVLSLRLVHGLGLQEIAHSLDLPLGTVKVRVHRGLALLRRALPASLATSLAVLLSPDRGLAAVRQVVLGHGVASGGGAAVGGTLAVGVLFGSLLMKKVAIVVALLAVAGAWWAYDARNLPDSAIVAVPSASAPVAAAAAVGPDPGPAPMVTAPAAAPADRALVRDAVPATGTLVVEVVWANDGEPAPGIKVEAQYESVRTNRRADAEGKVEFVDLAPGSYRVYSREGRMAKAIVADVAAGETRHSKMAVAGDLRLQINVVDDDGLPQPDATVWRENADGGPDPLCLGRTDGAGRLAYRGLNPNSVWAQKAGRQPSLMHDFPRIRPGEEPPPAMDVQLVLGPIGCSMHGTVVDPQGRAVADAHVSVACDDSLRVGPRHRALTMTTDAAGRFRCDEVPAGERYLVADAPGFAPTYTRVAPSTKEPIRLVIALRVGATLSGRVRDAEGKALANVQVTASRRQVLPGLSVSWSSSRSTRTDDDGRYRLEAILPDEMEATVSIEPQAVRQFTFRDGEQQTWDVVKEPDRSIRGVVVDAEGKPLVDWMVRSIGQASLRNMNPPMAQTDAQGRFRLTGLEDQSYRLVVTAPTYGANGVMGAAALVPRAVVADVRPSAEALTIRLDAAAMAMGWIEGSIAMPEGLQAKAVLSLGGKAVRGGGFVPQERLSPGETTFRIGPLPAGEYDMVCEVDGRGWLSQTGLRLVGDETLRLPPFAADAQRPLVVELRHADRRPAIGATVKLRQTLDPCP